MRQFLRDLAAYVREAVNDHLGAAQNRRVLGVSPGGDAQFDIDETAERAVVDYVRVHGGGEFAVYTEDQSLITVSPNPRTVLLVDPIDGSRPASAGLEMCMFSAAAAPLSEHPTIADVRAAVLMEIKSGAWLSGDSTSGLQADGFPGVVPKLSKNQDIEKMFWSIEFNGHPAKLMTEAYGHIIDASANRGGVFVFNSATYSISRIITGQLDAYVDVGNRILKDHPETEEAFRNAGKGAILHLFPYDIAAATYLARLAGVTLTDGYGRSLDAVKLLDISPDNQSSCIAAANPELHRRLLNSIDWESPGLRRAR